MKIAITAWGNRVSPVFDAARTLLIARIEDQTIKSRNYQTFHPDDIEELAALLTRLRVPTLICGAISARPADILVENHIQLISFVSGNAMDVLNSFATRNTIDQTYMMPGCSLDYARRPSV